MRVRLLRALFILQISFHRSGIVSFARSLRLNMGQRHSAIAEVFRRRPFVLDQNCFLVLPAKIPAGFSDDVARAQRHPARFDLAPGYGTRRAIPALWDFWKFRRLILRSRFDLPREQARFFRRLHVPSLCTWQ